MSVVSISTVHAGTARSRLRPIIANAVIAGVITGFMGVFADTAQAQVPTVNIQKTCRAAAGVMVNLPSAAAGTTSQNDVEICLGSENRAREQMIKDWSTYEASDRADCILTNVYLPTYTEWLTCLEMNNAVRQARQNEQAMSPILPIGRDGYMTLPKVRNGKMVY